MRGTELDDLDVAILRALNAHPRAGVLELSRLTTLARATVQSRMTKLEEAGVITGYGPDVDLFAAGFPVHALVSLQIAQGALDDVRDHLLTLPGVIEAYSTTGDSDVLCRVAARHNAELQQLLIDLNHSGFITRSTSVVVLSVVVPPRTMPLLASHAKSLKWGD